YTRKREIWQEFAQDEKVPISKKLIVTTGTKHALQCGGLTQAWCTWRCLPAVNTCCLLEEPLDNHFLSTARHLTPYWWNTHDPVVQKNDTVEQLIVTNRQLTNTITKLLEDNAKLL
ncbi:hypothetical protein ACHAW6_001789, partial [Cyclotella cf. meneghiniana]